MGIRNVDSSLTFDRFLQCHYVNCMLVQNVQYIQCKVCKQAESAKDGPENLFHILLGTAVSQDSAGVGSLLCVGLFCLDV